MAALRDYCDRAMLAELELHVAGQIARSSLLCASESVMHANGHVGCTHASLVRICHHVPKAEA